MSPQQAAFRTAFLAGHPYAVIARNLGISVKCLESWRITLGLPRRTVWERGINRPPQRGPKFGVHDLDRLDGPVSTQTATRCVCGRDRVIAGRCIRCGQPRKAGT